MVTGGMNATPVMNAGGYQYPNQQQMQQPMQVSPEQPTNPALGQQQQQQGQMQMHQVQQQGAYSTYQYNPYAPTPQMQQQQPLQPNMQPYNPNGPMTTPDRAHLTSPPISPLWTPASPEGSPPEGSPNTMQQQAGGGAVPSLPSGFPQGAAFDMFAPTPPTQQAAAPPAVPADPFGGGAPAVAQQQPTQQLDEADFWNDMGFGNAPPAADGNDDAGAPGNVTPTSVDSDAGLSANGDDEYTQDDYQQHDPRGPVSLDDRGLPAGGEYYKARVTTPMLGAIFSSAKELRSTLYKTASDSFVDAIGERPVISFTIDGSAADTAGIGLGHVLLKVNEQEVLQTDQAVKTVGAAARPMIMEFYVPNKEVKVVKTEGQCMVKYDNHSTEAPASACEWKPKYVVVGDMLGKPHILYMYRSKAEYDIAVKESQTRNRALSVKVKQFDIRGAKIFHERGTIQYPNKPRWYYFTVVRGTGLPIKISCRMPEELHPVYEGIVGFLDREARVKKLRMEQNRERMHMNGMYRETYY